MKNISETENKINFLYFIFYFFNIFIFYFINFIINRLRKSPIPKSVNDWLKINNNDDRILINNNNNNIKKNLIKKVFFMK